MNISQPGPQWCGLRSSQWLLGNSARCPYGAHSPQLSKAGQSRVWKRRRRPRSRGSLSQPAKVSPLDGQASSGGESGLLPDSGMATSLVTYFHSRAIRAHQFLLDQELTSSQKNAERLIAHSSITFFNWLNSELFIQGNLCATAIPS